MRMLMVRRGLILTRALCIGCVLFTLWFVPWVWILYFGVVVYFPYEPDGSKRFVRVSGPLVAWLDEDRWVSAPSIPSACKRAVVISEDMRFHEHYGIDVASIELALKKNKRVGKKRFGASTITQQLVKNVFLSRNRSYLRKTREVVGAIILDAIMSKELQLAWYFNVVEFGPRIYGLSEASRYYFKKKPSQLSTKECAQLVALLPSPSSSGRLLKKQVISRAMNRRTHRIMRGLSRAGS